MRTSTHVLLAALFALSACGGGGGGDGGAAAPVSATGWTPGVFLPSASFAGQCAAPVSENNWLRSWTNDLYLCYDDVVDRDPALPTTRANFDLLRTPPTRPPANPSATPT